MCVCLRLSPYLSFNLSLSLSLSLSLYLSVPIKRGSPVTSSNHYHHRDSSHSAYHLSCTCAMGADGSGSVTDNKGRVNGARNLRVVDASIMPSMVSGNLNASTIMIAEKIAAEMVGGSAVLPRDEPAMEFYENEAWREAQR